MEEKGLITAGIILALLVGGLFGLIVGYQSSPVQIEKVEVEKLVNQTVEVEKLVEVEVEKDWLGLAVSAYFDEVELDKYQEIIREEVADNYTVSYDIKRDKSEVKVIFDIEYKILDTLEQERETVSESIEVLFREGRDPKVSVL